MRYRPEIDGLRAVAVVPVILFHAGLDFFSGGFVGVDIFFVISGFLITSILLDELSSGRFSLVGFYERRARRILPALVVVCFFTAIVGALGVPGVDLKELGGSLASVSTFSANIYFWRVAGDYFSTSSELQPFLHTWSLAVEEQFYLFFPIFLLFAWRRAWGGRLPLPERCC